MRLSFIDSLFLIINQEESMDKYDPKNIDPRPRRRRDKDNPYRLFTVGMDTDSPLFYVEFMDSVHTYPPFSPFISEGDCF